MKPLEMNVTQDPADNTLEPFSLADFTLDPSVAVVLCGFDKNINYTKISKGFLYLTRNEGCLFLATNEDSTFPDSAGLLPGAGSVSAPLRFALGRNPLCTGKPSKTMLDCVQAKLVRVSHVRKRKKVLTEVSICRHNFDPSRTIMVGDRLNTDILFGQAGGVSTLLVLTGKIKRI